MERNYLSRKPGFQMFTTEIRSIFTENVIIGICRRNPHLLQTPTYMTVSTTARQVPAGIRLDNDLILYPTGA